MQTIVRLIRNLLFCLGAELAFLMIWLASGRNLRFLGAAALVVLLAPPVTIAIALTARDPRPSEQPARMRGWVVLSVALIGATVLLVLWYIAAVGGATDQPR